MKGSGGNVAGLTGDSGERLDEPPVSGGTAMAPTPPSRSGSRGDVPTHTQAASAPLPPAPGVLASGPLPNPDELFGLHVGHVLGKYRIVRQLGVGGMGSVYEAVHTGIQKPVALKTLSEHLAYEPRAQARFMREAAAASRLDHPHVAQVTDFGSDGGVSYIVMELLRGEDLAALLSRHPQGLEMSAAADVLLPVCAGVFAAHEAGVVHRDLKPQNVFLHRTSIGEVVPKVLDFGISKMLDEPGKAGEALTHTGMVIGTTHYMSPEQVSGRPVDGRSDQYALGVILYEALTGKRPHEGDTFYAIMRSIGEGTFLPPRQVQPFLPVELEEIVLRTMAMNPHDRFESVHALGRALLPFASAKRQVAWADFYDHGRAPVVGLTPSPSFHQPIPRVGPPSSGRTPLPGTTPTPGSGSGRVLPPTRTRPRDSGPNPIPYSDTNSVQAVASPTFSNELLRPTGRPWIAIGAVSAVVIGGSLVWLLGRSGPPEAKPQPVPSTFQSSPPPRRSSAFSSPPAETESEAKPPTPTRPPTPPPEDTPTVVAPKPKPARETASARKQTRVPEPPPTKVAASARKKSQKGGPSEGPTPKRSTEDAHGLGIAPILE